jgi:hypothetical protein
VASPRDSNSGTKAPEILLQVFSPNGKLALGDRVLHYTPPDRISEIWNLPVENLSLFVLNEYLKFTDNY